MGDQMDVGQVVSDDLQIGGVDNHNPLIMMGKKKRKKEGDDDTNKRKKRMKVSEVKELERRTEKISKLQEKRIQKYEEKIQKAKQREELYKSLSQVQLKEDQAKYMHSSRTLGKKETKKEKLKRAVLEEKAGLERSDPQVNVFVPRVSTQPCILCRQF
jgi:hypothetical protein